MDWILGHGRLDWFLVSRSPLLILYRTGLIRVRLIGIFGIYNQDTGAHWALAQSECSSTWGSTGYLLSSLCQWYEAVNKHPVEEVSYDNFQCSSGPSTNSYFKAPERTRGD